MFDSLSLTQLKAVNTGLFQDQKCQNENYPFQLHEIHVGPKLSPRARSVHTFKISRVKLWPSFSFFLSLAAEWPLKYPQTEKNQQHWMSGTKWVTSGHIHRVFAIPMCRSLPMTTTIDCQFVMGSHWAMAMEVPALPTMHWFFPLI